MKALLIALFLFLSFATRVFAIEPLVLRGMSAVPTEGSEWIALENVSSSTISAQTWSVRDVQGSIKTWMIPVIQPFELRVFMSTETKISLNNTGDQLELLHGAEVVQSSAPYENLASGGLWVLLSAGWQELSVEEWEKRWPTRDWSVSAPSPTPSSIVPSPQSSPRMTPSSTPFVVLPSPPAVPSSVPSPTSLVSEWWSEIALPKVGFQASTSAEVDIPPIWEREPGNFSQEKEVFESWKKRIYLRLASVLGGSVLAFFLCVPKLYRCYNDVCLFDE